MKARTIASRTFVVFSATIMLALSGSLAWATVYEYQSRVFVPNGVSIAGVDLSGMNESEARSAITAAVSDPLTSPLTVLAEGKQHTLEAEGVVTVDVDAMVAEAFAPRRTASFVTRIQHDVINTPLNAEVKPAYSVDASAVAAWVTSISKSVNRPAVDATVTLDGNTVKLIASKPGKRTREDEAVSVLLDALDAENSLSKEIRQVDLPIDEIKPKVTDKDIGKTIVVDISERRIRLFKGARLEKTYRCAVGTPSFPTPKGHFKIEQKRYRPTWVNPAKNGWGKDMPAFIPPGPSNPLGTRAINLTAPGIRFHGTTKDWSVGTAASHGCMRMHRSDIEDLFERVYVGMDVYIVP